MRNSRWRKPLRLLWRTFCWYVLFTAVAESLILLATFAAVLPGGDCGPLYIAGALLAPAHWPIAVAVACGQIAFAVYFGWRSMDDAFWSEAGRLAKFSPAFVFVTATLGIVANNRDFPVWTAYKFAMTVCRAGWPN